MATTISGNISSTFSPTLTVPQDGDVASYENGPAPMNGVWPNLLSNDHFVSASLFSVSSSFATITDNLESDITSLSGAIASRNTTDETNLASFETSTANVFRDMNVDLLSSYPYVIDLGTGESAYDVEYYPQEGWFVVASEGGAIQQVLGVAASTAVSSSVALGTNVYSIARSDTTFVACGEQSVASTQVVWTSTDADTWTDQDLGATVSSAYAVVYDDTNDLFILGAKTTTGAEIWTSPNGSTWTQRTFPLSGSNEGVRLKYTGGLTTYGGTTVALSSYSSTNKFATSTNGTTWTVHDVDNNTYIGSCYTPDYGWKVFTSNLTDCLTSTDASSWSTDTIIDIPDDLYLAYSVKAIGNLIILGYSTATGTNHHKVGVSSDGGATWSVALSAGIAERFERLAVVNNRVVVMGWNGDNLFISNKIRPENT